MLFEAGAFGFVFEAFFGVAGGFEGAGEAVGCYDCCGRRVTLAKILSACYFEYYFFSSPSSLRQSHARSDVRWIYSLAPRNSSSDSSCDILLRLPGLPKLSKVDVPPNVAEDVHKKALSGSVNCRKAGYLAPAPKTPATPRPRPAAPPMAPPLRVSLDKID